VDREQDRIAGDQDGPDQTGTPGGDRDRTAEARDEIAEARDDASEVRDARAEARDERAEVREAREDLTGARADRAGAVRDRQGGAGDRHQGARDRLAASKDRRFSAEDRAAASLDELTGAHRRDAGMLLLEHDVLRAKRTNQPFTLAFIDVDGLKRVNDSLGHAAGDQLLRAIADAIRARLRPYDVIVRYGGDEFLCGLLDLNRAAAAERFVLVKADLAVTQQASVTAGLAEVEADDALEELIVRADEALYRERLRAAGSPGA
jgi:diguanylate cyclase (GGDEF)-like protein